MDAAGGCASRRPSRSDTATQPTWTERNRLKDREPLEYFAVARAEGAEPLIGGAAYAEGAGARGMYIQPTVYARVRPEWRITREEIFGPVLVTLPSGQPALSTKLT